MQENLAHVLPSLAILVVPEHWASLPIVGRLACGQWGQELSSAILGVVQRAGLIAKVAAALQEMLAHLLLEFLLL